MLQLTIVLSLNTVTCGHSPHNRSNRNVRIP